MCACWGPLICCHSHIIHPEEKSTEAENQVTFDYYKIVVTSSYKALPSWRGVLTSYWGKYKLWQPLSGFPLLMGFTLKGRKPSASDHRLNREGKDWNVRDTLPILRGRSSKWAPKSFTRWPWDGEHWPCMVKTTEHINGSLPQNFSLRILDSTCMESPRISIFFQASHR